MEDSKRKELERWLDDHHLWQETKRLRTESNPGLFHDLSDFLWWLSLGVNIDDNMLNELLRIFEEADFVADARARDSVPIGGHPPAE